MSTIVITIISLCAIGIVSAVILYFVAQKFKVEEDPRIDIVEGLLPGANCGGCGYPGCRGLAEAAVKSDSLDGIMCPVGGSATMSKIAEALGREVSTQAPKIAVVKCNGNCENRPRTSQYDGARTCAIEHSLYVGETACGYGCLGCGDCVKACPFDAIHMDPNTLLPVVDNEKCVACESLPPKHHRVAQQRSERSSRLCQLRKQRQGSHCPQSMQGCLHRLWQVCKRVSVWCYHRRKQLGVHRFQQMPSMPQMCRCMSHRRHS